MMALPLDKLGQRIYSRRMATKTTTPKIKTVKFNFSAAETFRLKNRLSKKEMAERLGISQNTYGQLVNYGAAYLTADTAEKFLNVIPGLTIADLAEVS